MARDDTSPPPLNDPQNGPPRGGVEIVPDGPATRYQLVTRAPMKFYVVLRCYDNHEIGLSVHSVSTLDPCLAPRPIHRYITKAKGTIGDI